MTSNCEKTVHIHGQEFQIVHESGNWQEIPEELIPVTPGMKWTCLRCGKCCTRDWQIELSWKEFHRLKEHLPLDSVIFDEHTAEYYPFFDVNGKCPRYDEMESSCNIYSDRCFVCRSYPFYLHPPGKLLISTLCDGIGHGPTVDTGGKCRELLALRTTAGMDVSHYD
ncbi:MAG: YkgJ family cysteine cluster protein [Candidatus Thermoplasmatota archaeon]|jgi:Fe-S-cluster containining protein|nr:YkgJ family cysteine cluster protein [Candidatus Thermoplasmatota archaeon]MDP7265559.1 YkgJ family cysteine cluster protein [Candidatus Thermoplasmatota archaeon]